MIKQWQQNGRTKFDRRKQWSRHTELTIKTLFGWGGVDGKRADLLGVDSRVKRRSLVMVDFLCFKYVIQTIYILVSHPNK